MFSLKMVNDFSSTINNDNKPQQSNEILKPDLTRANRKTNKKSSKTIIARAKSPQHNLGADLLTPKSISNTITYTKVKSGSWKRSEKSIASLSALNTNKKPKPLRKKSPIWLKFSNSKAKRQDLQQPTRGHESNSAWKPGTLYSDVLFGGGSTNLVKIKNAERNHNNNTKASAQNKLTKALFKYNQTQDKAIYGYDEIKERNWFPALQKIKNKICTTSLAKEKSVEKISTSVDEISENKVVGEFRASCSTKDECHEEADVVILSDLKDLSLVDSNISYGNYLEQHFKDANRQVDTKAMLSSEHKQFLLSSISNIPKWNFFNIETDASDGFPKFLCQFEDENYLKAEKLALMGLKLALGNYSP